MLQARNRLLFLLAVAVVAWAGCIVTQNDVIDDPCTADGDCPSGYMCGAEQRGGRFCELIFPVRTITADAGIPDAGRAVFYCSQTQSGVQSIKSIMDAYCVACHGAVFPQLNVRLDLYDTGTGNGVRPRGERVKHRTSLIKDMPTLDAGAFPSEEERALVAEWFDRGSPFCDVDLDAGTGGGTGGGAGGGGGGDPQDSGTPDAGVTPVNYAQDIQPIWVNYCTGCHSGGSPSGGLDLSTATISYNGLINTVGCGGTAARLVYTDGRALTNHMLWRKLTAGAANRCGAVMPTSSALSNVDPDSHKLVERWLLEGATNL